MNEPVIKTTGLTKYFGKKRAVYELNLEVPRGVVFGFLGRNGSGKTTTIRMLLGLLDPTRGHAEILGHPSSKLTPKLRSRIGYMTESHFVYGWMKIRECGAFQANHHSKWNQKLFDSVIDHFNLSEDTKAKDLSRGERAGLSLALTLAPEPELLILDDPALGLDPVARRSLTESMIYLTQKSDRTIFFSSHLIADVERVADEIAILDHSTLKACAPVEEFRNRVKEVVLHFSGPPPATPEIRGLLQSTRTDGHLKLRLANVTTDVMDALESLGAERIEVVELSLEEAVTTYLGSRGETGFFLNQLKEVA